MIKFVNKRDPEIVELRRRAWELLRRRGKAAFVLRVGLLRWGGAMFFVFAGMNVMAAAVSNHLDRLPSLLLFNFVIWSIGGLLLGLWMWRKNEKIYLPCSAQAPQSTDREFSSPATRN